MNQVAVITLNSYFAFLASLVEIETWLKGHFSTGYASLQPGLAPPQFWQKTKELPFLPPVELVELYAWHNGSADADGFFAHHSFYSFEQALHEYLQNRAVSAQLEGQHGFVSWQATFWPVMGFDGEYFLLDVLTGAVWFYLLEDQPHYAFDSLSQFFACIAGVMHHGMMVVLPDSRLALHGPGFESLRKQLVSAAGQTTQLPLELEFMP